MSEDDLSTDNREHFYVDYETTDSMSSVRAYYPDNTFPGYETCINYHYGNIDGSLTKCSGNIPAQMVPMSNSIAISDENINNFTATCNGNADCVSLVWVNYYNIGSNYTTFNYYLHGSPSNVAVYSAPDLPEEIKILNPTVMDLNKMSYIAAGFFECNYFTDYADLVKQSFTQPNISSTAREYEYYKTIYKYGKKSLVPNEMPDDIMQMNRKARIENQR